jgi:hypothetical protein
MRAIGNLLQTIADDFVRLQHEIDRGNFARLSQYAQVWREIRSASPELAETLLPSTQSLNYVTVDVNCQIIRAAMQELELSILNLGYATKFELAQFGRCNIQIQLTRDNSAPRRPSNG